MAHIGKAVDPKIDMQKNGIAYEIRTRVPTVKGWCPGPLDERDNDWNYKAGFKKTLAENRVVAANAERSRTAPLAESNCVSPVSACLGAECLLKTTTEDHTNFGTPGGIRTPIYSSNYGYWLRRPARLQAY